VYLTEHSPLDHTGVFLKSAIFLFIGYKMLAISFKMTWKSLFTLLICWSQWSTLALGLDVAALNRMTAAERLVWVAHFVEVELNKKDSSGAFADINLLFDLADKWDAPAIKTAVYTGQGNYLLQVLHNAKGARDVYAQGVDYANMHDLEVPAGALLLQIGSTYSQEKQPTLAYEYYFRAHDIFAERGFHCIPRIDYYEYSIGRFLYDMEDYKAAMTHFSIAERFGKSGAPIHYQILMMLSQTCQRLGRPEEALTYMLKRAQLAQQENNIGWMGETAVDIGDQHLQDGCHAEARIYLTTGHRLSVQVSQLQTAARALILLSQVNIHQGNLHAAGEKLTVAENYLCHTNETNNYPDLYAGWMTIHEQTGNFREAYKYRELYDYAQDSIQRTTELRTYTNIQVRLEGRRHMMQVAQMRKAQATDQLMTTLAGCVIVILGAGAYFGWGYQQHWQKSLILARQEAEQALERALQQQAINQHTDEVGDTALGTVPAAASSSSASLLMSDRAEQTAKAALATILQLVLLTEEDSRHFRVLFEKIHPGFLAQLRVKFPDLTQSETRLLALTKLNLNTREMSDILNVEPNSIRRLRNRIRQKFNLPTGDNLESLFVKD